MTNAKNVLKEYFGHESFLEGQEGVVNAILSRRDAFAIMPTGGGKSVCYQVPSLIFEGVTIVISPLISLMKDQIQGLNENGISAAYINSSLSESQVDKVLANARNNRYKILYIAPERLLSSRFLEFCYEIDIPFVAVDEAHCVSQWGQDFRPSYRIIPEFIARFKVRPTVAAFTATATQMVREDIVRILGLNNPHITLNSFDRKNLYFEVRHGGRRYDQLKSILNERKGQFGIVYCSTRRTVDEVSQSLISDGFNAQSYHAGLADTLRHEAQDSFIFDRTNIMVATNAFGMGINKSNVSFVIHYNMPKDIESYYQEAGRAGRDGSPADCILLYSGQDLRTNLFLIENSTDKQYESEEQKQFLLMQERARLKAMDTYCNTSSCQRNFILKYFGENTSEDCGNCGNCNDGMEEVDITITAQKILSCIVRTNEAYGKNTIIDILRGSKSKKMTQARFTSLSTYGVCVESEGELKDVVTYLVEHDYLHYTNGEYPLLKLGVNAPRILRERIELKMRRHLSKKAALEKSGSDRSTRYNKRSAGLVFGEVDEKLLTQLKVVRREIADKQGVPAFIIFHDSTLIEMSAKKPQSLQALAEISGVGRRKLEAYGEIFISQICNYLSNVDQ